MNKLNRFFIACLLFASILIFTVSCAGKKKSEAGTKSEPIISLPRTETPAAVQAAADKLFATAATMERMDIHSMMIVQHGNVIFEKWQSEGAPDKPHALHSVSKTFTATAVGMAIAEGKLSLDDKLVSFFPDKLPAEVSDNLKAVTVRDLLTMNCGHETETTVRRDSTADWVQGFLAHPVPHKPGTWYCYNSMGTYMLSAIVQKVTGQKVVDYLDTRLFQPLHIDKPTWQESPQGINTGGWGLFLKTEDLAKMGQLFLQKGKWNGEQILSPEWVAEASAKQVPCVPSGTRPDEAEAKGLTPDKSDWVQGYGYQMWRCRHNAFRADGANGQYIIVIPEKDAVVAVTANVGDMQAEINLIWDYILPVL